MGWGSGIVSFYALNSSANCCTQIVDPIVEGSDDLMFKQYNSLKKNYEAERINFHRDYIDTLLDPNVFDIIVMNNNSNKLKILNALLRNASHQIFKYIVLMII